MLNTIITGSWILAIQKNIIFGKNLLENKEIVFKNWAKYIQADAYNDARLELLIAK